MASSLSGGPMPEHQFDDAMRWYSKNDKVASYSSRQPHRLVLQGAKNVQLLAGPKP